MLYLIHLATIFGMYAILAVSLNLVAGYTGLLSVAHAAFFGVGAYAVAFLAVKFGVNFFLALFAGVAVAAAASFLVGIILSRLGGDYYVLGSVSFNYIVVSVFMNWESVTNGPLGISGIPRPSIGGLDFSSNAAFFILIACVLCLMYFFSRWIVRSSFGRAIRAIREDEEAIEVFGYRALSYKLAIFVISAGMASVAGGFFASYISFVDPSSFGVMESVFILAMVIVGGSGNIKGSFAGALALVLIPELLRFAGFSAGIASEMRQAIYGLILILLMLYRPQGLMGEYKF